MGLNEKNHSDLADAQFVADFQNCTLPPALFSHEAHLRLAWLMIEKHGDEADTIVSRMITNYVNHLGAVDKYHHTLTVAAVKIVAHFKAKSDTTNFQDFILQNPRLKTHFKELIHSHYSSAILKSAQSKTTYLRPDLMKF